MTEYIVKFPKPVAKVENQKQIVCATVHRRAERTQDEG